MEALYIEERILLFRGWETRNCQEKDVGTVKLVTFSVYHARRESGVRNAIMIGLCHVDLCQPTSHGTRGSVSEYKRLSSSVVHGTPLLDENHMLLKESEELLLPELLHLLKCDEDDSIHDHRKR